MTIREQPSLAETLDAEIERVRLRADSVAQLLRRDALKAATYFEAIARASSWQEMANSTVDPNLINSVCGWQARLDELVQRYGALTALRANYAPELRARSEQENP